MQVVEQVTQNLVRPFHTARHLDHAAQAHLLGPGHRAQALARRAVYAAHSRGVKQRLRAQPLVWDTRWPARPC